ncbi:MAG: thioredoxin family protein [Isosphaeraceae bacterium]|nr:thioredoxin family protein [Isosphaeraceae bacterium]
MKYALIAIAILAAAGVAWYLTRKPPSPMIVIRPTYDGPISQYQGGKTLLVAVYAPWASVWRATSEALAGVDHSRYDLAMIDADRDRQAVRDLGVEIIPTVLVFREGKEIARLPNMMSLDQLP